MTVPTTNNTTFRGSAGLLLAFQNSNLAFSIAPNFTPGVSTFALTNTAEHFNLAGGTFSASYSLPSKFLLTAGGAFQVSSRSVLSGDQLFQLGGPTSVRGYITSLFAAPTGYYANFELHRSLDSVVKGLDVFTFYDRGSTYTPTAITTLNSVGAGLVYDYQQRLLSEVSFGVPLDHPSATQAGVEAYFRITAKFDSNRLASAK